MGQPIKKTMVGSPEVQQQKASRNTKPHCTLSDIRNEPQTASYWAGQRIEGPIRRFEIKDDYTTKLQNQWYGSGLFGPRHWNGYGRMI